MRGRLEATRAQPGACAAHPGRVDAGVCIVCAGCAATLRRAPPPPTSARASSEGAMCIQLRASFRSIYTPAGLAAASPALRMPPGRAGAWDSSAVYPAAAPYTPRVYTLRRGRCPWSLHPARALRRFPPTLSSHRSARAPPAGYVMAHGANHRRPPCVRPLHTRRGHMAPRAPVQRPQDPGEYHPSLFPGYDIHAAAPPTPVTAWSAVRGFTCRPILLNLPIFASAATAAQRWARHPAPRYLQGHLYIRFPRYLRLACRCAVHSGLRMQASMVLLCVGPTALRLRIFPLSLAVAADSACIPRALRMHTRSRWSHRTPRARRIPPLNARRTPPWSPASRHSSPSRPSQNNPVAPVTLSTPVQICLSLPLGDLLCSGSVARCAPQSVVSTIDSVRQRRGGCGAVRIRRCKILEARESRGKKVESSIRS
ncbi:hypothetical protein FB451DRAFT_1388240 [Mycena latifolia]|nr:hypothetical protein FB451DRAFT_1388240 [Mycena latifolia]